MSQDPSCGDLVIAIHMLDDRLPMPVFAHPGDAGADLATAVDIVIEPGERVLVPTGIAIAEVYPAAPIDANVPRRFLIYPGGAPPRVGLRLANERGAQRLISLDPITGIPQVERIAAK